MNILTMFDGLWDLRILVIGPTNVGMFTLA